MGKVEEKPIIARSSAIHTTVRFRFHDLVTRTLRFGQGE
jgi:hypothetical protein